MENASKALIIAGAILISILLISVGILVFNSTKGVAGNAGDADDAMAVVAAEQNAKIILNTMDINDDNIFNNYLISTYGNRKITATEARELAALITERCKKLTGKAHSNEETHITSSGTYAVHHYYVGDKIIYNLDNNKLYEVRFDRNDYGTVYSVKIYEAK